MEAAVPQGSSDEFKKLVDELEDIELRRSGSGGFATLGDAARLQHIERRLLDLVGMSLPQDERRRYVRLPCDMVVLARLGTTQHGGKISDLGAGGVFVSTALAAGVGDEVELELERRPGTLEHGLKVKGRVAWTESKKTG